MSEVAEIDCWHTDEIVCPYCGHVHKDSWEHQKDNGEIECENEKCGKKFRYARDYSVTYSTVEVDQEKKNENSNNAGKS